MLKFCIAHFLLIFLVRAYCPTKWVEVSNIYTITSDDYLSTTKSEATDICEIQVSTYPGDQLLLSITNFLMFSHRRPKNTKGIVIVDGSSSGLQFVVDHRPKGYHLLKAPIVIKIPMNLNFRSILTFSKPIDCQTPASDTSTFPCPKTENCYNCSHICFNSDLACDGFDTCAEDESGCTIMQTKTPLSSYKYGREALSSSQIMLIGFFALNGSFIVFFLLLSLCSAGIFVGKCQLNSKKNAASRHTFIRYLREAIPDQMTSRTEKVAAQVETNLKPAPVKRHSILSRINFQPAPAVQELEPEVEDREQSPVESICSPPAHQPEIFLRRQSLPFGLKSPMQQDDEKETSSRFGHRTMSVQI